MSVDLLNQFMACVIFMIRNAIEEEPHVYVSRCLTLSADDVKLLVRLSNTAPSKTSNGDR